MEKSRKNRRHIITEDKNTSKNKTALIIIGAIIAIYLIITVIFSFIALPGTNLNGKDISFASKSSALAAAPEGFTINVKGRDGRSLDINSSDINYKAELPKDAKIDQNPFSWPLAVVGATDEDYEFNYKVSYDEDKLNKIIENSELVNGITEPKDAKVVFKDNDFEIEKEVEGNKVDESLLKKAIIDGINSKEKNITLTDDYYINPKIKADSKTIEDILADGKKIQDMKIGFNFTGFDFKLAGDDLLNLFKETDNGFELDYDKTREYVENMASETDTYGTDRKFNATGIGQIIVNPGVYGFILDVDGMIDKIYELVNDRKSGDIEPIYTNRGYSRASDGSDIDDTYVEVDISRQHLWFYKDGNLIIESDLVTGLPTSQWATNVGVGSILNKVRDISLVGLNFDGVSEYDTPVRYRMPIGRDGEGFHDADRRGAFGGSIYLSDGSHGCLNLPPQVAAVLFENVDNLTPVIVYESSSNNSPPMTY